MISGRQHLRKYKDKDKDKDKEKTNTKTNTRTTDRLMMFYVFGMAMTKGV